MTNLTSRNSPYAPVALREEIWWQIGRRAAQRGDVDANGASGSGFAFISYLTRTFGHLDDRLQRRTRDDEACAAHHLMSSAMDMRPMIAQFELHGRQIFDFSRGLVNMLEQTDVSACSLRDLQLPYPALYIRFGPQVGLPSSASSAPREYIDGVLVAFGTERTGAAKSILRFATTSVTETGARVMEPGHFIDLRDDELQLPVQSAIEAAMKRFVGDEVNSMPESPWVPAFCAERRQIANAAISAAMPLIVNSLFYLENPPRPHRTSLGSGTPDELVGLWERTPPDRRRKLQSRLNADGYTLVHLVGVEVEHSSTHIGDRTVTPHWRRGHWREQAHGPRLSLRKRILIKPMLVNGRDVCNPLEVQGHIYHAGPDLNPSKSDCHQPLVLALSPDGLLPSARTSRR
jgi:hypothetical protein